MNGGTCLELAGLRATNGGTSLPEGVRLFGIAAAQFEWSASMEGEGGGG